MLTDFVLPNLERKRILAKETVEVKSNLITRPNQKGNFTYLLLGPAVWLDPKVIIRLSGYKVIKTHKVKLMGVVSYGSSKLQALNYISLETYLANAQVISK